ncbi:hypothetical protein ACFLX4_03705, partial [Chloroflexota bacterium]
TSVKYLMYKGGLKYTDYVYGDMTAGFLVGAEENPGIGVVKSGPTEACVGETITYTYSVSLAIDSEDLSSVTIDDNKVLLANMTRLADDPGNNNDLLEEGEVWKYEGTYEVQSADQPTLVNEVTVTGMSTAGTVVTGTADWSVTVTCCYSVACVESYNPPGKNIPPAGITRPGPGSGQNEDGFYELSYGSDCPDGDRELGLYVGTVDITQGLCGPYTDGTIVKITESPGAKAVKCKKIGSTNGKGKADAVYEHITVPSDPVIYLGYYDANSNFIIVASCGECLVPPFPK